MPSRASDFITVWTGRSAEGNKALRAQLSEVAAQCGYLTDRGPATGQGSVGTLLVALAEGEVAALAPLDNYIHVAVLPWLNHQIEREKEADRDDETVLEFLVGLRSALLDAFDRRQAADTAGEREANPLD